MECNKEEAVRAKEIAEKKMQNKDFVAARKIALKAQHLFPELENISQILAVCDIHCSAENRAGGTENDWYGILQVEVTADETAIKKQFRKLALLLHPDKNKFFGAEAAFKLIGEAQRVLLDPRKRLEHDMKRRAPVRTTVVKFPPANRNSYGTSQPGVQGNYMSSTQCTGVAPGLQQPMEPFWTTCPFCGMKYQYYRNIINRSVRCQSCTKPFIAYDMNIQGGTTGNNSTYQWNQPSFPRQKEVPSKNSQKTVPQSSPANFSFNPGSQSKAAEGDNADKGGQTKATVGNVGEAGSGAHKGKSFKKATRKRGRKAVEESSESYDTNSTDIEEDATKVYNHNIGASGSRNPRRSARQKQQVIYKEGGSDDDFANSPTSKRSKREMESNVTCDPASNTTDFEDKNDKEVNTRSEAFEEGLPNGREQVENIKKARSDPRGVEKTAQTSKVEEKPGVSLPSHSTSTSEANSDLGIAYSEPEFYDFDQDRTESKFKIDQIWALYDDREGMPRYYARIRKLSSKKFRVGYTWLESNPHDEDWVTWVENKFPIACGLFKHGESDFSENVAMFSHLVSWEKGSSRATYKIWPRKGDVWALFKDWDLGWSKDPEKYRKFEFEVVEVLSDYVEESGVEVAYLVKVKGFSSLFQRMTIKGSDSFQIPSKDLLRFSHRIPSHRMSGNERKGVVKGSFELDPASVPSKLDEVEALDNFDRLKKEADSLKEKDSVEKQTPGPRVYSPRRMNGAHAKKSMVVDEGPCEGEKMTSLAGGKGSVDGVSSNKRLKEANSSKPVVDTKQGEKQSRGSSIARVSDTFELPDSEFHNFESDKSIDKFQMGQFWALYSQEDGMPKYYARIEHVGSRGFSVRVKWLEACPESEEEILWSERVPLGCGLFKLAKSITHDTAETFSHQVQPDSTSQKTRFQIYPKKAEVWAIYKNWRSGTSFDVLVGCVYEMVEILDDDGPGRRVLLLGKVDGYNSVFKGIGISKEIPRSEFLRFSHQVPAFHLTDEVGGKLRGYLELDPASLPAALLSKTGK